MNKISCYFFILLLILTSGIALADRGQLWPDPVKLAEDSQKAIILHNRDEEVLILGTELRAERETAVLEFIPFPTEPEVSLAQGEPFTALQELISQKQLEFLEISKGGDRTVSVELRFNAQIGAHDVTVIRINDIEGFSRWVKEFFRKKRIKVKTDWSGVYRNVEDYLKRGYHYFVFDYVPVKKEAQFVAPLVYRFKTDKLYYPLKTSNIIGGTGRVELALILPGSLGLLTDRSDTAKLYGLFGQQHLYWDLSSSAKVYPAELKAVYPKAGEFFKTDKSYLQVVRFYGEYEFKDDLTLDISMIAPYAFKHAIYMPDYNDYFRGGSYLLTQPFSAEEKKDLAEAYSKKRPEWVFTPEMLAAIGDLLKPGEGDGQ